MTILIECTVLNRIYKDSTYPFSIDSNGYCQFLYPYEEPPKQRMTNRMLSEWLAKGNGQKLKSGTIVNYYEYLSFAEDAEVPEHIRIRCRNSEEWIEPTVDIYERDCKGVKI